MRRITGETSGRIATRCRRLPGVCRLADERPQVAATLSRLQPSLVDTVLLVQRLAPRARVVLVGYPALLPPRGDCPLLPRMRPQDRATFRAANHGLSVALRAAARETGVEYVDVERAWAVGIGCAVVAGVAFAFFGLLARLVTPWSRGAVS